MEAHNKYCTQNPLVEFSELCLGINVWDYAETWERRSLSKYSMTLKKHVTLDPEANKIGVFNLSSNMIQFPAYSKGTIYLVNVFLLPVDCIYWIGMSGKAFSLSGNTVWDEAFLLPSTSVFIV